MDNPVSKIATWGLLALATARLTRFITSDFLGEWMIVAPLKKWAVRDVIAPATSSDEHKRAIEQSKRLALEEDSITERDAILDYGMQGPYPSKRARLVKGLDCPFCVGFWIGGVILLGEATIGRSPLRPLWRFGIAMLGLNYLVGHISSRIDG
ncbi:hypothetical protein SEA_ROBSFEET_18 [Microbacterium phage RobsFeet]|uniref:DUF1360 domain-containing protein n=1 Tax=Microbacterium phage RobsFeet TaxID=2201442 RepID=A0A2Z4Q813_9CAUD|nr:hypothetical protein HOT43_gp18 [Microbacterium phage RobsFeet]AWY06025.2 hypothetical protein SEA_ROBSFEET_18 [Microbacterium phage RobsFeet]